MLASRISRRKWTGEDEETSPSPSHFRRERLARETYLGVRLVGDRVARAAQLYRHCTEAG